MSGNHNKLSLHKQAYELLEAIIYREEQLAETKKDIFLLYNSKVPGADLQIPYKKHLSEALQRWLRFANKNYAVISNKICQATNLLGVRGFNLEKDFTEIILLQDKQRREARQFPIPTLRPTTIWDELARNAVNNPTEGQKERMEESSFDIHYSGPPISSYKSFEHRSETIHAGGPPDSVLYSAITQIPSLKDVVDKANIKLYLSDESLDMASMNNKFPRDLSIDGQAEQTEYIIPGWPYQDKSGEGFVGEDEGMDHSKNAGYW